MNVYTKNTNGQLDEQIFTLELGLYCNYSKLRVFWPKLRNYKTDWPERTLDRLQYFSPKTYSTWHCLAPFHILIQYNFNPDFVQSHLTKGLDMKAIIFGYILFGSFSLNLHQGNISWIIQDIFHTPRICYYNYAWAISAKHNKTLCFL